jgi:hypothetical protein
MNWKKKAMGNHCIDCEYCKEDTRGLSGVGGCDTQAEADKCYHYKEYQQHKLDQAATEGK